MTKFTVVTHVQKANPGEYPQWKVDVEVNGFVGHGEGLYIGKSFEAAYDEAVAKLVEGTC